MWQALEILLISAIGSGTINANVAEQPDEFNSAPAAQPGELYPAVVVDQGSAASVGSTNLRSSPEDATWPGSVGVCHDSPGFLAGPCVFDSFWDVTGGRPPTDYICNWAYGPDCTVARARVEWLLWFSRGREAPVL